MVFQLSGGTTGIPKLIPRTHNDYVFNSRLAVSVYDLRAGDVLLDALPIAHNLPLAGTARSGLPRRSSIHPVNPVTLR